MKKFKIFLESLILENLHPELQKIVQAKHSWNSKQSMIAAKVRELSSKGEETGIEGNMPKGSSRAYLKHKEPYPAIVDGEHAPIRTGTKVVIRSPLDKYHNKMNFDNMSIGQIQNHAENHDGLTNNHYRILTHLGNNKFKTNKSQGIFPPLIEHDNENDNWSHVGHSRDIKAGEFRNLTKTKEFPKGISHEEFCESLNRDYNKNNGRYYNDPVREEQLNKREEHPLIEKFLDYHRNSGNSPYDYRQKKNMGIFEHPDGSKHIVARDHGFSIEAMQAYRQAIRGKSNEEF